MSLYKIFHGDKSRTSTSTYVFSVIWAVEGICSLYLLQGKAAGGSWHQIITQSITDSDGEISCKIGEFVQEVELTIMFGTLAMTDLKKMAVFVTNTTTGHTTQMKPDDVTKDLDKPGTWVESFTFKTF